MNLLQKRFSIFSKRQNYTEALWKHQWLDPAPEFLIPQAWDMKYAFLTSSQKILMRLARGPHFENYHAKEVKYDCQVVFGAKLRHGIMNLKLMQSGRFYYSNVQLLGVEK